MREHVKRMKEDYLQAGPEEKTTIVVGIFDAISAENGRFVQLIDGIFYEVPWKRANDKIRQCLRDRRTSGSSKLPSEQREQQQHPTSTPTPTPKTSVQKTKKKKQATAANTSTVTETPVTKSVRLKLKNLKVAADATVASIVVPGTTIKAPPQSTIQKSAFNKSSTKKKPIKRKTKKAKVSSKAKTTKKKSAFTSTATFVPVSNEKGKDQASNTMATGITVQAPQTAFAFTNTSALSAKMTTNALVHTNTKQMVPAPPDLQATPSMVFLSALIPPPQGPTYLPTPMECFGGDDGHDDVVDFGDVKMANRIVVSPTSVLAFEVPDGLFSHGNSSSVNSFYKDNFPSLFQEQQQQQQQQQATVAPLLQHRHKQFRDQTQHEPDVAAFSMSSPEELNDSIVNMPSDFMELQHNLLMNMYAGDYTEAGDHDEPLLFPIFQD